MKEMTALSLAKSRGLALIASVLLCACAGQPQVQGYQPKVADCCSKVSDYDFQPAKLGQEIDFQLTEKSPALSVTGHSGHMFGLKVPDGVTVSSVVVRSYLATSFLPNATIVAPDLYFYDADFRLIKNIAVTEMHDDKGFWRASLSARVQAPPAAKFIVVMAGRTSQTRISSANGTPYLLPPAALGDMSIRLFGEGANAN